MASILAELREGDFFNIMQFSSDSDLWEEDPAMVPIRRDTVASALEFVQQLRSHGGKYITQPGRKKVQDSWPFDF